MAYTATHDEEVREEMLCKAIEAHNLARDLMGPLNALEALSFDLTADEPEAEVNRYWVVNVRKAREAYWQLADALNNIV